MWLFTSFFSFCHSLAITKGIREATTFGESEAVAKGKGNALSPLVKAKLLLSPKVIASGNSFANTKSESNSFALLIKYCNLCRKQKTKIKAFLHFFFTASDFFCLLLSVFAKGYHTIFGDMFWLFHFKRHRRFPVVKGCHCHLR